MSRRLFVAAAMMLSLIAGTARDARGQELTSPQLDQTLVLPANIFASMPTLSNAEQLPSQLPASMRRSGPSAMMTSLYVSTATMQALDVHSTLKAFSTGAVEANPLMTGVTKSPVAFIALKAGVAASTIMAARQMAKHNKVAAVVTLVAVNSAYAMVVSHNYRVANSLR